MQISLIDMDFENYLLKYKKPPKNRFPNLALMKISAWHKSQGDHVDWYSEMYSKPDVIYSSKAFSFSRDCVNISNSDPLPICGGSGYNLSIKLPEYIENIIPDYSIYPNVGYSLGFLSRGCIRKCEFCVVPKKEGNIHIVEDIEKISNGNKHVVLLDNNFLACEQEFVKEQLEKANKMKISLDFNQGLDARLITPDNAKWLSECKWKSANGSGRYIRMSCDSQAIINPCKKAINYLRKSGYKGEIFIYFLAKEVEETLDRISDILSFDNRINPFVMPYLDLNGNGKVADINLKNLANWCNKASVRKTCNFINFNKNYKK